MDFQTKIQYLEEKLEPGGRLVVVSDVHGHRDWLEKLLAKVGFCKKDILIIVGDLIEKGEQSLAAVRYAMELSENFTVYMLMGNVDLLRVELLLCGDGGRDEELYRMNENMEQYFGSTFLSEMCREAGLKLGGPEDIPGVRKELLKLFQKELDFLKGLPTILETERFTFVHGGLVYEKTEDNLSLPPMALLKNDDYISQGKCFSKYLVVGHWPACLYRSDKEDYSPYIQEEQRIIGIDGGCGVKDNGQLNALLIPGTDKEEIKWESVDDFPVVTALEGQEGTAEGTSIHIRYFESQVRILKAGKEFSLAEHIASGRQLNIYNERLDRPPIDGELNDCWSYTDYCLPVKAGDTLSLIYNTSEGILARKHGMVGWYHGLWQAEV